MTDNQEPNIGDEKPSGVTGSIPAHMMPKAKDAPNGVPKMPELPNGAPIPGDTTIRDKIIADREEAAMRGIYTPEQIAAMTPKNGVPTALGATKLFRLQQAHAAEMREDIRRKRKELFEVSKAETEFDRQRRANAREVVSALMGDAAIDAAIQVRLLSTSPLANAAQLASCKFVLAMALGEEMNGTVGYAVDFSECESISDMVHLVTTLYGAGKITKDENEAFLKNISALNNITNKELSDRLNALEISEHEASRADKAKQIDN